MSDPRLLLVEVLVDGMRYTYEADSGRVWCEDEPARVAPEILRGLRAESLRRYLDAAIDEAELGRWVRRIWGDAQVVALSMPADDPAPTAAQEVQTSWQATPQWCDVETVPPRTVDVASEPAVHVFDDHVEFEVRAYALPGRQPAKTALLAGIWDTCADAPVLQALLAYDPTSHLFRGAAPRLPDDDELGSWRAQPQLLLDVTGVDQGFPVPRDEDHELAWRCWYRLNRRWASAPERDAILDGWAPGRGDMALEVVQPRDAALDVVVVQDALRTVAVHPAQPREENAALRRLGLAVFYGYATGGTWHSDVPAWRHALDVDMALAWADADRGEVDLSCASTQWLLREAAVLVDAPASYYTGRIARACETLAGRLHDDRLMVAAQNLQPTEWPDIEWALVRAAEPATRIAAGASENLRAEMAQWWLDMRAGASMAAWGRQPVPVYAPLPAAFASTALLRDYDRCLGYAGVPLAGAEEPLLAELRRARPLTWNSGAGRG